MHLFYSQYKSKGNKQEEETISLLHTKEGKEL